MTDTDLIAAGSGAEEPDTPTTATPEISTSASSVDQERAPQRDSALATMVLPELRALANEVEQRRMTRFGGTMGCKKVIANRTAELCSQRCASGCNETIHQHGAAIRRGAN